MLGFAPLASAPLADDGATVYLSRITSGAPVVQTVSIAQEHNLTLLEVATVPDVPDITMSEEETFNAVPLNAGFPDVPDITMSEEKTFNANLVLSGFPFIEASSFTQGHNLTLSGITAGEPTASSSKLSIFVAVAGRELTLSLGNIKPVLVEFLQGRVANLSLGLVGTKADANQTLTPLLAEIFSGQVIAAGEQFDFNSVRDLYSRRRTVIISEKRSTSSTRTVEVR